MRIYRLLLASGILVSTACGRGKPEVAPTPAPPPPAAPAPPAEMMHAVEADARLYYDDTRVFTDSARVTIRDRETLRDLWNRAGAGQESAPPLPSIDWSRHMVVLVSAGAMRPGDQIRVDSAGTRNGRPVVVVRTTVECQAFAATAYPFEIVRVDRSEGPVTFVERGGTPQDCE